MRVLVIGGRMLREIVEAVLSGQPGIDVVRGGESGASLVEAVDAAGASCVIIGNGESELAEACTAMVRERPRVKAMAIVNGGRQSFLYELRPYRVALGEVSPQALIDAVRSTAAQDGEVL
jgi:DNA-binding NarL/FixJ family response regulator